ncbi:DUF3592 domain-containing protein [Actinoplanes sp. NEAU-A12]|uniref:DUF3592 domain-containing protein n=1 Tax=Actinoplanes sandaracinus TaxID=3045177 RepID=A0ABT6WWF9_9ACTN|nr:DUF3592 domain-containing protein [Actinoplanes sandaracinus]MDI6104082.1 DUF3592 domain-containing protein [Actinoplanes sandaracinus]
MKDTANPQEKSESRRSYRKVWWMRFCLPLMALVAWWYFAGTAEPAYHLTKEGVVVSGEVTRTETFTRTDYMIVRFTTSEGRQVETSVAPKNCGLKQPGDTIKVRYLPSDPHTTQDACDSAHHYMSVGALLAALGLTAISVQAWRLWWRYRKVGQYGHAAGATPGSASMVRRLSNGPNA